MNRMTGLLAACAVFASMPASLAAADDAAVGRAIYENGILPSGEPVVAEWPALGISLSGPRAACARCHRISGSGGLEGDSFVPPVTGPALFEPRRQEGPQPRVAPSVRVVEPHYLTRPPYQTASLARALRDGVNPDGHVFSGLMPRYTLDAVALKALEAHLRQLSAQASPGIEGGVTHFATVITPGRPAADRKTVVDVLRACFEQNHPRRDAGEGGWRLHVWDLEGPASDWERQLRQNAAAQPVFAIVSGLGSADWAPVQRHCAATAVPCLFPNVDVPGAVEPDRYSFYFSAGTALEGRVMARWLSGAEATPKRVVQLYIAGDARAEAGVAALKAALLPPGMERIDQALADASPNAVAAALRSVRADDAVMLWLPGGSLQRLMKAADPPDASLILASGWLADPRDLDVSVAWRKRLHFTYAFDPPARYELRMNFNLMPWLNQQGIKASSQMLAGNTLTACNLVVEGMATQRGVRTRDKLIESLENYDVSMRNGPAPQAFYSFSLGPGQRFSSKGAFIVRYADETGRRLQPVVEWIVP